MEFLQALKNRRSIYNLGTNVNLSNEEITSIISDCLKHSPSAFNYPTTNVIIAFGEKHQQIWQITTDILKEKLAKKEETFAVAQNKINKFKAGVGTILFFEDTEIINELKETYAMYAENFSTWSNQANGMLQNNIWTALSQVNIGANLQHYNPLIDDKIKELFSIPDTWKLTAQMPFGSIEAQANEKYIEDISTRLKVY
jgi:predicted oxidoreductase (fatty acid repression mutant protein)